jgi:hypothetical protein
MILTDHQLAGTRDCRVCFRGQIVPPSRSNKTAKDIMPCFPASRRAACEGGCGPPLHPPGAPDFQ